MNIPEIENGGQGQPLPIHKVAIKYKSNPTKLKLKPTQSKMVCSKEW